MRLAVAAALVLSALAAGVGTTEAPGATNGKIAFERGPRIWSKSPTPAATETTVRNDGWTDGAPAYSPDGTRLAFVRRNTDPEIFVTRADGTGTPQQLTHNTPPDSHPAWSPDGTQLVFERLGDIWVMNADGSDQRMISVEMPGDSPEFDPDAPSLHPAWSVPTPGSPGGRIAFIHAGFIWTMTPTGADKQALPHSCATANGICDPAEALPAWSPDGTALSYNYYGDVYLVTVASGISIPLANTADGRFPGAQTHSSWSPDGRWILLESAPPAGSGDVAIARSSGLDSAPRLLTNTVGPESNPSWQPKPECTNEGATAGADVITGTPGADILCGLGGNDTIDAGRGSDFVFAGGGADRVIGGLGHEVIDGGPGGDTIDYGLARRGVEASLTTEFATGDGFDVLLALERIDGSPFADTLAGSPSANLLRGFAGADSLDVTDGVGGNDTAAGGPGVDTCVGDAGDRLTGCP